MPYNLSESEEMYLLSIIRLVETGVEEPVPLSRLAEMLEIMPVSANQMVHRLAENGLACYTPYKGVSLTDQGRELACRILRRRRLWQVFLVEHLGYGVDEADRMSCRLEHILPDEAMERLSDFLSGPRTAPDGGPIPDFKAGAPKRSDYPLVQLPLGQEAMLSRVQAGDTETAFLEAAGMRPGKRVRLLAKSDDEAFLLRTETGKTLQITAELAGTLWMEGDV
jgi:DtxR family Mn-dependent transcriptional regulator